MRATTLGAAASGDPVNVEVDLIAKYVQQLTRSARSPILGGDAVTGKERTA
jgi:riboflavin synthase alpha subunit